jgi:hypothetical protein
MATEVNTHPSSFNKSFSQIGSYLLILLGTIVLLGWTFNVTALKSVFPGLITMKPNTAIGFLLLGISLVLVRLDVLEFPQGWRFWIQQGCASVVALMGILTLLEFIFDWNLGIDQLFFGDALSLLGTSNPVRMAPQTALCFTLSGFAMMLVGKATRKKKYSLFIGILSLFIFLFGLIGFFSYLSGAPIGYHWWNLTGMAIHTVLAFILIGIVLFSITWQINQLEMGAG